MKFSLEKAPHLTSPRSTRKIMTILSIALLVLGVYAIVWYFVNAGSNYGVNAILIFVVSVLTSVLCDALWAIPELKNKKVSTTEPDNGYMFRERKPKGFLLQPLKIVQN